jgi:large subunit ribosomal protein L14e
LKKLIEKSNLLEKFSQTSRGRKIQKQAKRAALNDFERFKVLVLKRKLGKQVRTCLKKTQKSLGKK